MNKLSALGIARIVRAVADPLNHPRLDAAAPELVASLEAGLTCYAALDLIHAGDRLAQIRFTPRFTPRGAGERLTAMAAFQFVEETAAAALEIATCAVRVARAAALAQAVIDIAAAGGTVPVDADFAQLLEISPEGAAASLRNLAAAVAAGHPATIASIEPAAGPPPRIEANYARHLGDASATLIEAIADLDARNARAEIGKLLDGLVDACILRPPTPDGVKLNGDIICARDAYRGGAR